MTIASIHKEEVVIVFRVDPDSKAKEGDNVNNSGENSEILQHCKRSCLTRVSEYDPGRTRTNGQRLCPS